MSTPAPRQPLPPLTPPPRRKSLTLADLEVPTPLPMHVEEFKQLYHARFGVMLDTETALTQLIHLLVIVKYRHANATLYPILPPQQR